MDGELFLAWIEQFLCPTLQPGDIVILDNLSSHKVDGVQQAVALAGAVVLYLPPYSPDLNPIEKLFSKLKTLLRKAAVRATDEKLFSKLKTLLRKAAVRATEELWTEIGTLLNTITASECSNYFTSSGHVST